MLGTTRFTRGVGTKRGVEQEVEEITPVYMRKRVSDSYSVKDNNFIASPSSQIPPPSQSTTQIIRSLDGLETFPSPHSHGSTLIRRVIENEDVDTPREQHTEHTQTSGKNLSSILRSMESSDKSRSDSHVGADFRNPTVQLEAPTPVVDTLPCSVIQKNASHSQIRDNLMPVNDSEESRYSHPSIPANLREKVSKMGNAGSTSINRNGPSRSYSLNTTQLIEEFDDDELSEADSVEPGNGMVSVKGYNVQSQYVDLLTSIISKYGDIGANCAMKTVTYSSISMEHVCIIFQNLEKNNIKSITHKKLKSMMNPVTELENERVDVGWLRKRLDEISEAKKAIPKLRPCSDLKLLQTENLFEVEKLKDQLEEYKKKVNSVETALSVAEAKLSETQNLISEISMKLDTFTS